MGTLTVLRPSCMHSFFKNWPLMVAPATVAAMARLLAAALCLLATGSAAAAAPGWDPELYCVAKRAALQHAQSLLPQRDGLPALHDSLQLSTACGDPAPDRAAATSGTSPKTTAAIAAPKTLYVSPEGSDEASNDGTDSERPLRTLQRATGLLRLARDCPTCGGPGTILLGKGTYFMRNVLHLEPNDSGLTIAAMPGLAPEDVVLSAGTPLANLTWGPSERGGGVMKAKIAAGSRFSTLFRHDGRRAVRGRHPNANPETEGLWTPHARTGYGNARNMTTFSKELLRQSCSPRLAPGGDGVRLPDFVYGNYSCGRNAKTASGFTDRPFTDHPFVEFWCGAWSAHTRVELAASSLPAGGLGKSNALPGAEPIFTVTKGSDDIWANFQFVVSASGGIAPAAEGGGAAIALNFSSGGQQGPWGSGAAAGWWFIENALGLVDEPGEWWVDAEAGELHYFPNSTAELSQPLVASSMDSIIEIRGTRARPVEDITIIGVTFAHTEVHYTKTYESQGGGGITMHRGGALIVEGAVGVTVDNCVFEGIGGHGVLLSNYVRVAKIANSEFKWIGASNSSLYNV